MCLDEINGLMAGYALSALDADELKKFEGHLATCPDCRAGVAEMQPLIDALSMMNKKCVPSDALRERVMESARAEPKIASYCGFVAQAGPLAATRRRCHHRASSGRGRGIVLELSIR